MWFRIMMIQIAREKALSFEPPLPNAETIAAMRPARADGSASFDTVDALMADFNATD